jgi:hypothetical protein
MEPVGAVIATEDRQTIAMLRRRKDETFMLSESALTTWHLTIFVALALASTITLEVNSNKFSFCSVTRPCKRPNGTSDADRTSEKRSMIDFGSHGERCALRSHDGRVIIRFITERLNDRHRNESQIVSLRTIRFNASP